MLRVPIKNTPAYKITLSTYYKRMRHRAWRMKHSHGIHSPLLKNPFTPSSYVKVEVTKGKKYNILNIHHPKIQHLGFSNCLFLMHILPFVDNPPSSPSPISPLHALCMYTHCALYTGHHSIHRCVDILQIVDFVPKICTLEHLSIIDRGERKLFSKSYFLHQCSLDNFAHLVPYINRPIGAVFLYSLPIFNRITFTAFLYICTSLKLICPHPSSSPSSSSTSEPFAPPLYRPVPGRTIAESGITPSGFKYPKSAVWASMALIHSSNLEQQNDWDFSTFNTFD